MEKGYANAVSRVFLICFSFMLFDIFFLTNSHHDTPEQSPQLI